jgi:hypothetical protein
MPSHVTLRDLLAGCLGRQGVPWADERIEIRGDAQLAARVWAGFSEFAALPVPDVGPGLSVPGPGRSDTDRLGLEALPASPAGRNTPAQPPTAWLSRRIYIVDAQEEWQGDDEAALRLVFDEPLRIDPPPNSVYGAGGPSAGAADDWIQRVEASPLGRRLMSAEHLDHAVLE